MVQWSARLENKRIEGQDHLGVESSAQTYQGYLLAGVITTTPRIRYFSFYAWVLHRFLQSHDHDLSLDAFKTFIQRYELTFILGCYYHHRIKQDEGFTGIVGISKAPQIWEDSELLVDLNSKYLGKDLGGLEQPYGSVIKYMGVMRDHKHGEILSLTKTVGRELAEAFDRTVQGTRFYEIITSDNPSPASISKDIIEDFGERVCLCRDSLQYGHDREPLRKMLFRFDLPYDLNHLYVARRMSLGLLLDLAQKASGHDIMDENTMQQALYLGAYSVGQFYTPDPTLEDWYFLWRMVILRETYTNGLHCLFRAFTDWLNDFERETEATFEAWLDELDNQSTIIDVADSTIEEYLQSLCQDVGLYDRLNGNFNEYCTLETGLDEITLFNVFSSTEKRKYLNTNELVSRGLRILCQVALRSIEYQKHPLWSDFRIKAGTLRLPIDSFVDRLQSEAENGTKIREFLKWIFRDYIIGQHEIIALGKLSKEQQNTFRFTYSNGVFYSEDTSFKQSLEYPGSRIYNAIRMLIDVDLLSYDENGGIFTTPDGMSYLSRVVEAVEL